MSGKKIIKKAVIKLSSTKGIDFGGSTPFLGIRAPWSIKSNIPEFSVKQLRQLFSEEKARILHVLRAKKPKSLYALAKELGRDFKAVRQDVKILENFGFITLISEQDKKTNKKRLKPVLALDKLEINIEV